MTIKRKTFSKEFKQEAVRLLEPGERSPAEIARELGINRNQLYKWQEQIDARSRRINGIEAIRMQHFRASYVAKKQRTDVEQPTRPSISYRQGSGFC